MNPLQSLRSGEEPDPRFSLANERTFLSWIRTSLGLIAAALGLEVFGVDALDAQVRVPLVLSALIFAAVLAASALVRWFKIQRALRNHSPLPLPGLAALVTVFFVALVVVLVATVQL